MSEYLIQSETLDNIANAINAKTGGSSAMTPAEMVTEIAAIPSGGGSLPSVISKIDGGSFTFANDTNSVYSISHSLGTTPKGFVIWTDEINLANSNNNAIIRGAFIADKSVDSETSYLYQIGVYNHGFNGYARNVGASYSGYANSSTISYNIGNVYYASGINYKWFAWA